MTTPPLNPDTLQRSATEGVIVSVLVLALGSFSVIGASANAPLISNTFDLSAVGVGAIASVAYFGAMVSARWAGRLTDQRGPTLVLVLGMGAVALGDLVSLSAFHAVVFYLGILVIGLGYGAINPPTTVMSNPASAQRRALVLSIKQSGVPVGGIAAGAILPLIGLTFGWRVAFALACVLCVAMIGVVAIRGGYAAQPWGSTTTIRRAGRRLRLPGGYLFGLLIAGVQVSIFAFTAVYLVEAREFSPARAGLGVSLLLIGGVIGRLFWGWLSDISPHQRIRALQATAGIGAMSIAGLLMVPETLVPVLLLCVGLTSVGWNGVYIAAVAEAAKPGRIGAVTGTSLTLINLGAIVIPVAVGVIVHLTGSWTPGLLTLAGLSICAGLVAMIFSEPANH